MSQGVSYRQRPEMYPSKFNTWMSSVVYPISSIWTDIRLAPSAKERVGYPTQKPLALLERIIRVSSNEGDVVLDPFCGCATACVAAEDLKRQWVGIDLSSKAAELVIQRFSGTKQLTLLANRIIHRTDIPRRTDLGKIIEQSHAQTYALRRAGRPVRGLLPRIPLPQLHHRPYRRAGSWRDGPPRQPATAVQRMQLDEGYALAGRVSGHAEANRNYRFLSQGDSHCRQPRPPGCDSR